MTAAYQTGKYRNVFLECGYSKEEIQERVEKTFETIFYGTEEERFYHEVGEDMAYVEDTGNHDVRTEGMSYAMMVCVQMNRKEEFDRLWKWVRTYMYIPKGPGKNYFAWSCGTDGTWNSDGPAPDGEEFFAMSLFFAWRRWGDGEGIFEYSKEARAILKECVHKGEPGQLGDSMWDAKNHLIKFIPNCDFSDPSYHLPHFYELFAKWANPEDREFWKEAAKASRDYLHKACHPKTGLSAEYADYDGTPHKGHQEIFGRHDWYYSDAYRTIANIGLDYEWFGIDEGQYEAPEKLLRFLDARWDEDPFEIYEVDGTSLHEPALHPVGLQVTTTQGILSVLGRTKDEESIRIAKKWLEEFFRMPLRKGDRRYYDNCLYFFAFLALSGNYRIW